MAPVHSQVTTEAPPATTGPARDCRFSFAEVGFPAGGSYTVRDCWTATERKGLAAAGGSFAVGAGPGPAALAGAGVGGEALLALPLPLASVFR